MRSKHGRPREPSQEEEEEEEEAWRRGGWACHGVEDPPAERASHAPSAPGGLCKAKANQFFRNPVARRSSFYINFALRSSLRRPFFFLRIFVPCNSLTFITKISKMKFFGRGKALATEVAVGGLSDSDNTTEKHNTPGVDADALERIPSQNVQDGVKKAEAVTLTWTRNQLIIAYGWQELHSYRQS
jgi:hypothetical protein